MLTKQSFYLAFSVIGKLQSILNTWNKFRELDVFALDLNDVYFRLVLVKILNVAQKNKRAGNIRQIQIKIRWFCIITTTKRKH